MTSTEINRVPHLLGGFINLTILVLALENILHDVKWPKKNVITIAMKRINQSDVQLSHVPKKIPVNYNHIALALNKLTHTDACKQE